MRPENANYLPGELFYHNHLGRVGIGRIPLGTQACQSLCECPSGSEETRRILCVQHVCVLAVLFVVDVVNTFNQCVIVCQSDCSLFLSARCVTYWFGISSPNVYATTQCKLRPGLLLYQPL